MGRRIEVELTSARNDGMWTWRAAGAREPKGELVGTLLYEDAKVGDVVKVDAEFHVDGIEVVEVFAPRQKKERTGFLELKSRPLREDEYVTAQRSSGRAKRGRARGNNDGPRRDRDAKRPGDRRRREPPPQAEQRPKPKRLRPKRTHRDALLAQVAEEHRPIVEQVIKDGLPGVRSAIEKQNAEAKEAGKPEVEAAPILAIAESNLQKARLAEWRDRADAALSVADDLDLRDLRSVVVAGNDLARDAESREISDKLKQALDARVEADHVRWLSDLEEAVNQGRVVRALRLSSRPVKAGAPLPSDLATTLAGQASESLNSEITEDRWGTVLDALAYSPVRGAVAPAGTPSEPGAELVDAVKRVADRLPAIAAVFGIDPASVPRSAKRRRPRKDGGNRGRDKKPAGKPSKPSAQAPKGEAADAVATAVEPDAEPANKASAKAEASTAEATAPVQAAEPVEAPTQPVAAAEQPDEAAEPVAAAEQPDEAAEPIAGHESEQES